MDNNLSTEEFDDASFFEEDKEALITKETKTESNPDLYRISLDMDTVKNKIYNSRGRFIKDPTWRDANGKFMAKYHKKMYYMTDPDNTDRKFYVECPSNWNVPTSQNIISSAFFKLRESESVSLKRIANRNFGQIKFWWSLFQILIDEQQPEMQGKIKIMRFGKPVNEIIEAAVNGQPNLNKLGCDVYNPFKGKDFFLQVFEKTVEDKDKGGGATKKFPSYEKSSFDDQITAIQIDGERVQANQAGKDKVLEYIKKEAPSLQQVEYVKWDEAMETKVIESMRITIGDDAILDQIINDCRKGVRRNRVVVSKETQEKMDSNKSSDISSGSDQLGKNLSEGKKPNPVNEAASSEEEEEATFNNEGLPNIDTEFEQLD